MAETITDADAATYSDFDRRYLQQGSRFGVERVSLTSVPEIDLSAFVFDRGEGARSKVAAEIRDAAINIGFFYLRGHGFAQSEFKELLSRGRQFFALPRAEKEKIHWNNSPGKGYIPLGGINANANAETTTDQKERLYFARESALDDSEAGIYPAQSRWPDEGLLPGFRRFITGHTRKSVALAQNLGRAFARSLDLPETHFVDDLGRFGGALVYNYYPPLNPATIERSQWSFSPHTDYGAFTVLLQDQSGGLQVRNTTGQWIDVAPVPGTLIVNIGDMLAMLTNDLYTSNLHRVLNFSGQERLSVSFFVSPPPMADLRCLETCYGPGNPPRYGPIKAGEYHRMLMEQYHRTGRPGIAPRTAERLRAQ
jgi:isopenicillin N synthase-like dioxygenase